VTDLPWIMSAPTPWPYSSPRRTPLPLRTAAVDPAWARHSKHLRRPNGQLEEFHYIGALAEALGKSPCSVRRWERESVLPPTPFRHRVCGKPARDQLHRAGDEAVHGHVRHWLSTAPTTRHCPVFDCSACASGPACAPFLTLELSRWGFARSTDDQDVDRLHNCPVAEALLVVPLVTHT